MRFHAEHRFGGAAQDVSAILTDPDFYRELPLPDLSRPEGLEQGVDGEVASIRLRYEFVGSIDPIAL